MRAVTTLRFAGLLAGALCANGALAATGTVEERDAARLLTQATFGPTQANIDSVARSGVESWLNTQMQLPATLHRPQLDGPFGVLGDLNTVTQEQRQEVWWRTSVTASDQLRQRVAFALSEIMVTSDVNAQLAGEPLILAEYYDTLLRDAFGNYRQLLEDVTLSPAMGLYLSMIRNEKGDPTTGRHPDENFARESQQLFSIGLRELNPDGSAKSDAGGQPIPTYTQSTIDAFARAFTGWTWADAGDNWYGGGSSYAPMISFDDRHDADAKTLLSGVTLPAGQTAAQDLKGALDNIFNHPNVGPFIGRRLIQRLVTSNPSPAYIQRVAQVFDNNGSGMRGDLKSVIYAILTDPEARAQPTGSFGKPREPLLKLTAVWRAFNGRALSGQYNYPYPEQDFFQAALRSPSVFNFFQPDFKAPGEVAQARLYSPEFQIQNETQSIIGVNAMTRFIRAQYKGFSDSPDANAVIINVDSEGAMQPAALVDHLDLLMLSGGMSDGLRGVLTDYVSAMPADNGPQRAADAIFLIATSPEFAVQK